MYQEESLKYLEHDILTFPVSGKSPLVEWRDIQKEDVEKWSREYSGFGTAVECGEKSGLVFIDIDTTDIVLQNIIKDFIEENFPSSMLRFGNKKRLPSLLYKYDGQSAKKIMIGRTPVVEILSDGRYCVLPNSPHPDQDEPFEWGFDFFEYINNYEYWPTFSDSDIERLRAVIQNYLKDENELNKIKSTYDFKPRVNEPNSCAHGSHAYLFACICSLLNHKKDEEIVEKMIQLDYEINEKQGLTSYWEDAKRGATHGPNKREAIYNHIQNIKITINRQREQKGLEAIYPFVPIHLRGRDSDKTLDVGKKVIVVKKEEKVKVIPKAPEGALQDMFQAIYESSPVKRSRLSLCSALNIISTGIGTNIVFQGTYANLFSLILAESGSGKDAPIKAVHKTLRGLGFYHLIGEQNIVSTKGVIAELEYQPERIDTLDEFGKILKASKVGSGPLSEVFDIYNQLYTEVGGFFSGAKIDRGERRVSYGSCNSPYVNLMAATTPSAFSSSYDEELFLQGWGSRALVFVDTKFKKSSYSESGYFLEIPDTVKKVFSNLRGEAPLDALKTTPLIEGEGRNQKVTPQDNRKTITIGCSTDASLMLRDTHAFIEERKKVAHEKNDAIYKTLRARQFNMIKKISLISSVANNCIHDKKENCLVRGHDVEYALNIVGFLVEELKEFIELNMYKTNHDKILKKIQGYIESKKDKGASKREIIIKFQEYDHFQIERAVDFISEYKNNLIYKDIEDMYYSKKFVEIQE